jgi:hypothetical protein
MKRRLASVLGRVSALIAGLAFAKLADGAPPPALRVVGEEGACPSPMQVAFVLKRLLRQTRVTSELAVPLPDDAAIVDRGTEFRVTIAGQERSFADPARGCAERAQNAAVFVALVLDPPTIADLTAPEPAPPPAAPPAPPAPEKPRHSPPVNQVNTTSWDFTVKGLLMAAPAEGTRQTAVAGGFGAWIRGQHPVHIAVGAGLLKGALDFTDVTADAWWIPLDVALGFAGRTGSWEVAGEIGPNASLLSIAGRDLKDARSQIRLELGARAAGSSRFWLSQNFALFLSAEGIFRPMPYALQINPQGEVGQMPSLWFGGAAGLSAALE